MLFMMFSSLLCNVSNSMSQMRADVASVVRIVLCFFCLGCLDALTTAHTRGLTVSVEERERQATASSFTKEDYLTVNRFESMSSIQYLCP